MDNGTLKKIILIAGATLVGFVLVVLLCLVSFMAGSIDRPVQPIYGYAPPSPSFDSADSTAQLENDAIKATALLYHENSDGEKDFYCTATAFEREGKYYKFITAAHCVSEDDPVREIARIQPGKWYLNFDLPGNNGFHRAHVLAAGYQTDGDDVAVLGAYLDEFNPIIKLSKEDAVIGERIINVAGPLGLGKQLIRGNISQVTPGLDVGDAFGGRILLQIHCGGGSSGSSIISEDKKAIVGVLVAGFAGFFRMEPFSDVTLAVPIGKFHRFWAAVRADNYEHFNYESFEAPKPAPKPVTDDSIDSDAGIDAGCDDTDTDSEDTDSDCPDEYHF